MKTLNVTFTARHLVTDMEHEAEFDVIINTDLDEILNEILDENDIPEEEKENWELSQELTSSEDIHINYLNTSDIFEYAEAYESSSYDLEIINAGIDSDTNLSDIDEAYSGSHNSDQDFAEDMADQLGYLDEAKGWPFNCIDWEYAAKELMYDYTESNGHYFRNM